MLVRCTKTTLKRQGKTKTVLMSDITDLSALTAPNWADGRRGFRLMVPNRDPGTGEVLEYWSVEFTPSERKVLEKYLSETPDYR